MNCLYFFDNQEDDMNLEDLLNHQFGDSKTTCLHLAAKHGHKNIVWTLLLHGADPSVRDKLKKVPFMFATEKETRNVFRKFMGEFPDKYDYKTAQVPPPLSKEAEEEKAAKVNEKKKAQRLAKREKDKVEKVEEQKIKKEKEDKENIVKHEEYNRYKLEFNKLRSTLNIFIRIQVVLKNYGQNNVMET